MKPIQHFQTGQGMTEYIIIVAMIAIAAIAVYQYFGQTVRNQTAAKSNAQTSATSAETTGNTKNTLDDYVNQKGK